MFSPIAAILEDLHQGKMIVLVDDERRENEGDLVLAAEKITPDAINFMLRVARGYLCLSLTGADCDRLELRPQAAANTSVRGTAFTVSIDGAPKHGLTTGVSSGERARTIQLAIDPDTTPDDFVRPGHINPLRARDGGVLVRAGQTEGSVDLCRLAGLKPAAVIIEIMRDDGEMARMPDLEPLCAQHDIKICSVAQIIEHRLARETLVHRLAPVEGEPIHTREGDFNLITFASLVDPQPHVALTLGDVGELDDVGVVIDTLEPTLVRMHRRDVLGDVFGEISSATGESSAAALRASMRAIQREGKGAIVYLRPQGVGNGLAQRLQRIRRPALDDMDVVDAMANEGAGDFNVPRELREFGVGGQILRALGISRLRLLTNHPKSLPGLEAFGLEIVEHTPLPFAEKAFT